MPDALRRCLLRDLDTLGRQLAAYPDDHVPWQRPPGVPNSAGHLVLHCCGNLRHFLGAVLGATGYQRNRDAEFTSAPVSRSELSELLALTRHEVDTTLRALDPDLLDRPFPVTLGGVSLPVGVILVQLATHLAYHLGQVDFDRRLLTGDALGVDAMAIAPLLDPDH